MLLLLLRFSAYSPYLLLLGEYSLASVTHVGLFVSLPALFLRYNSTTLYSYGVLLASMLIE